MRLLYEKERKKKNRKVTYSPTPKSLMRSVFGLSDIERIIRVDEFIIIILTIAVIGRRRRMSVGVRMTGGDSYGEVAVRAGSHCLKFWSLRGKRKIARPVPHTHRDGRHRHKQKKM